MTNLEANESKASADQVLNFSWWLCMLPFFASIGFFVWRWLQDKSDSMWLLYSVAALVIGLIFTALVAGVSNEGESATSLNSTTDDTTS